MLYCGIDLSSFSIALGIINEQELVSIEIFAKKSEKFEDRFRSLTLQFDKFLSNFHPDAIYIEAIPYVKSARTALVLAQVLGMVSALCHIYDVPFQQVNNMTWKKGIGLKGRVTKDQTKELVTEVYSITTELTENQYDAIGVTTYALRANGISTAGITFAGAVQTESSVAPTDAKGTEQAV